jgi:hypothetical protein
MALILLEEMPRQGRAIGGERRAGKRARPPSSHSNPPCFHLPPSPLDFQHGCSVVRGFLVFLRFEQGFLGSF